MEAGVSFVGSREWFSRPTWFLTNACCYDGGVQVVVISWRRSVNEGGYL
jgi:hypothetical protein